MELVVFLSLISLCVGLNPAGNSLQPDWKNINTIAEFDADIQNAGDKLVVVQFFEHRCQECNVPEIIRAPAEYPDALMIKVNKQMNNLRNLVNRFKVVRAPTFVFIKKNEVVNFMEGFDVFKFDRIVQNSWIHVETNDEFDDELVYAGNKLVVVKFFVNEESKNEAISTQLEKLPHKFPDVYMIKVNVENCPKVVERLVQPTTSPTFTFMENGDNIQFYSTCNVERVEKTLNDLLLRSKQD
ncbi:uncharacterized protein LOC116342464 [Contarinia nasturtii]|uniref:uncharacterized protein LOC116342464 n=1 Tax=Contarinia nasturtii TaxID=265458 RepID=UPI0012D3CEC1|nr:uncharacterized protein LOC116342464 [Contarinia nasturtii]